jgi:predicted enzyme involved in methoxymalonyl-ACP biosynthesis
MGLEVEIAAVAQIGAIIRDSGAAAVFAAMVETDRNQPCRNLYASCGFEAAEGGWRRSLTDWLQAPNHISLKVESTQREKVLANA